MQSHRDCHGLSAATNPLSAQTPVRNESSHQELFQCHSLHSNITKTAPPRDRTQVLSADATGRARAPSKQERGTVPWLMIMGGGQHAAVDSGETSLPWHLGIDVTVQKLKANAQRERSLRACFKRSDIPKRKDYMGYGKEDQKFFHNTSHNCNSIIM